MTGRERRRYPRREVRVVAVQRVGNRRVPRTVTGASAGGLFLAHDEQEPVATRIGELIVLEVDTADGERLKVTGEAARITEEGIAVRLTRADWRRLSELLGRLAGDGAT